MFSKIVLSVALLLGFKLARVCSQPLISFDSFHSKQLASVEIDLSCQKTCDICSAITVRDGAVKIHFIGFPQTN